MKINQYQNEAVKTAKYQSNRDMYLACALALSSEAGEVAGKVEKKIRKGQDFFELSEFEKDDMIKELGDILWHVSAMLWSIDIPLSYCLRLNLMKLKSRDERNMIHGEGDNR